MIKYIGYIYISFCTFVLTNKKQITNFPTKDKSWDIKQKNFLFYRYVDTMYIHCAIHAFFIKKYKNLHFASIPKRLNFICATTASCRRRRKFSNLLIKNFNENLVNIFTMMLCIFHWNKKTKRKYERYKYKQKVTFSIFIYTYMWCI